ncbi:MAG: hypothetical protein LBC68_08125 [Prevotellaceae bacterium]|jgi:hypothetical protein|nr:hypothetical protein [Prevotellaceae bacterium]
MNTSGGAIEFDVLFNTDQIKRVLNATKREVQDFSEVVKMGGQGMESAYQSATTQIEKGFKQIGTAIKMNDDAVSALEKRYNQLGAEAAAAFNKGNDKRYSELTKEQSAIKSQINAHKQNSKELQSADAALVKYNKDLENEKNQVNKASTAQVRFRTQLLNTKNQMMQLAEAGKKGTAEYQNLTREAERLQRAMNAANAQVKILTTTKGTTLSGILSGVTGLSGAFTAAQGAMGLFADKNEDLQRIMLKVQSLMSITIGLQQVSQALHTSSAFRIGVVVKLQEWWNTARARAIVLQEASIAKTTAETVAETANTASKSANTAAEVTNTAATAANTAATGAQTGAATAGAVANRGLALSFRTLGQAIKSIPGIGWIVIGITALVSVITALTSATRKAKKEQQEFFKAVAENASKPIATFNKLSTEWKRLGNDLSAKEKFIRDNKKQFDELGVAVKGVVDAENLLVKNKQAFIDAQLAKAKAVAILKTNEDDVAKLIKAEQNLEEAKKTPFITESINTGVDGGRSYQITNPEIEKYEKEIDELNEKLRGNIDKSIAYEQQAMQTLAASGIQAADDTQKESIIKLKKHLSEVEKEYESFYNKQAKDLGDYINIGILWEKMLELKIELSKREPELNTEAGIEAEISRLEESKKDLAIANEEYKWTVKEIEKLKAKLPKTDKKTEDPVKKELEEKKRAYTEYFKQVEAGFAKEAQQQYATLLKSGKTYREYLENRLKDTKLSQEQINKIRIELAEETEKTVTGEFEKGLKKQLDQADTLAQKLEILRKERESIAPDDPLREKKTNIITTQSEDVDKQIANEMRKRIKGYSAYLQEKLDFDLNYNKIKNDLELQLEKETNEEKKRIILTQLEQLEKDREKYDKQTGDKDYDDAAEKYRTFQQKRKDISDEFDELIRKAQEKNNLDMVAELEKAKTSALSDLSLEELKSNDLWKQLFGDFDKLSVNKMIEIRNKIEEIWNELDLDPEALKAIRDEMDKITNEIRTKNPFKALSEAIKQYKKDKEKTGKGDTTDIFKGIAASIDLIKNAFDAVMGGMEKMGIKMDEETQVILEDIGGILNGASQLSKGIASGDPLQIIQGSVELLSSAFDLFNSRDRDAEKSIKQHEKAVNDLQRAYNQLSWAIDKALGNEVYKNQKAAIANMKTQQYHLQQMWEAEQSKKDPDANRIADFKEQYAELGRQIEDMIDEISRDILQTDAKSFADELGDALADAFAKGENAATAFGDTVNKIIKDIILNQLKKNFIEEQIEPLLADMQNQMGHWGYSDDRMREIQKLQSQIEAIERYGNWGIFAGGDTLKTLKAQLAALLAEGDEFIFTGLSDAQIAAFKAEVGNISEGFNQALEAYSEIFKDLGLEQDTSLTGAVKGVTEETASIVAGQLNAIRINQSESIEIIRQQLAYLSAIAQNTTYNRYLESIDARLYRIENSDALRAYGIGG